MTFLEPHEIVEKRELAPRIHLIKVRVPLIALKARAGHFVIVRTHEEAERIPLTIADSDPDSGTITLVVQEMGRGTAQIGELEVGDRFAGVLGPLGRPGRIEAVERVLLICGGIGVAPIHPYAKAYRKSGASVTTVMGARSRDMLIMMDEMRSLSDRLLVSTDDGSFGTHGFVTDVLAELLRAGESFGHAVCIGPAAMMRAVCKLTAQHQIPTTVSLNPIMVDGTGMCGGCRVTVSGETKFACVDGPEFDGHAVDFDELIARQAAYRADERSSFEAYRQAKEGEHTCRLRSIE